MDKKPKPFNLVEPTVNRHKIKTQDFVPFGEDTAEERAKFIELLQDTHVKIAQSSGWCGGWVVTRDETDEEYIKRVALEEQRHSAWKAEKDKHDAAVAAYEEQKRLYKENRDAKYKDPEYIEFLRMKAKMEERGFIK